MPQAQRTVTINRPVEAVFAFVTDGERSREWRPGVLDIKRVSGDGGAGTKYEQNVSGPMGRRVAADYEITMSEPNRTLGFQTVTGPVRPHGRYDLEPADGGTRLSLALGAEMSGLKKLLMGSMVQKTIDSEVAQLDKLKGILEA